MELSAARKDLYYKTKRPFLKIQKIRKRKCISQE